MRPDHDDAVSGFVVAVDRGRFTVHRANEPPDSLVFAIKARELGRKGIVVGDHVALVGDMSGGTDALARIVRREPRHTVLRRGADDDDVVERVVVANADTLAVVVSLADPPPRTRLIDRALVAAFDGGLRSLLVLTKADLADAQAVLQMYQPLGIHAVVTSRDQPIDDIVGELVGRETVMMGASGVGKSTLVNRLVPQADRATGVVNAVTGRGRHTSTSAVALPLPGGGWIVDTPGIRSFGLGHVDLARFMHAFPDLEPGTAECPRGCTHQADDSGSSTGGCALDAWVTAGHADQQRLASLRRLLHSRSGEPDET